MTNPNTATTDSLLRDILLEGSESNKDSSILLLDGGVSTHLQEKIAPNSFQHRELWSSSLLLDPHGRELIQQGHVDWLNAGCDIISTVTYQCHYETELWPREDDGASVMTRAKMNDMFRHAVELARRAQMTTPQPERRTFVAVSLGCFGAALANGAEYTGIYGTKTLHDLVCFHRDKLRQAIDCRPDAIAFETIPSQQECRALVQLLSDESLQLSEYRIGCWISLACRNETELNDGTLLWDALNVLAAIPARLVQGFGLNCCAVQHLSGLVSIMVRHMAQGDVFKRAIILYPNTGELWDAQTQSWKKETGITAADDYCDCIMNVLSQIKSEWPSEAGHCPTIVVGGCCRTRPEAIKELRRRIDES
ncbi:hypothetical protein MPSEU_000450400 [Mayamaea pseudoterrestris]|nr:hypothetical protein MPSEU_000450400 [Mayamaea pseudoterrestris]